MERAYTSEPNESLSISKERSRIDWRVLSLDTDRRDLERKNIVGQERYARDAKLSGHMLTC